MRIKRLNENAIIPTRADQGSAGYDLYVCCEDEVIIQPHETVMLSTGWAMEIPYGHAGFIYARSGLASKKGLAPANCVGVVDPSYRGEIKVALHNYGTESQIVHNGDRVAQIVFHPYVCYDMNEVDEICSTDRGDGGFGHTGD